jgi:hypothetical protein
MHYIKKLSDIDQDALKRLMGNNHRLPAIETWKVKDDTMDNGAETMISNLTKTPDSSAR